MAKPVVFVLLGLFLFFVNTSSVLAALMPLHPDLCPSGTSSGPPPQSTNLTLSEGDRTKNQAFLRQINACPNACYDLVITLSIKPSFTGPHTMVVDTKVTDICKPANEENLEKTNRGCTKGQNEPRLTIEMKEVKHPITQNVEIPGKLISSKSRCDKTISNIVDSMFAKASPESKDIVAALEELGKRPEATVAGPPLITETNALVNAYEELGLDRAQAEDMVKSNPVKAAEMLRAIQDGDINKAGQIAKETFKANDQLNDAVRLAAERNQETSTTASVGGGPPVSQNTFGNPPGVDNREWQIDPRGEPQYPVRNSTTRDGQLKTVISPEALGRIIEDRSETFCATVQGSCYASPEAFVATQMNETTGDVRVSGDGGNSQSLAQVYSAQSGFNTYLAQYKAAYGEDYMLHRVNLRDPSINPEWIASQSVGMQAVVLQDKGQNAGGNYARLVTGYNGSGAAAAAYGNRALNNTQLLQGGRADPYWQAVYNTAREGGGPAITNLAATGIPRGTNSASPFGNVSPFTTTRPVGTAGPTGTSGGGAGTSGNPITQLFSRLFGGGTSGGQSAPTGPQGGGAVPNQQPSQQIPGGSSQQTPQGGQPTSGGGTSPTSPVQQLLDALSPGGSSVSTPAVPVEAVASILVQPQEVERGGSLVVSWSSVGTSSSAPCHVILTVGTTTSVVAQGNEGTRSIQTSAATPTGGWDFRLRCTAAIDGELFERNMSALVK